MRSPAREHPCSASPAPAAPARTAVAAVPLARPDPRHLAPVTPAAVKTLQRLIGNRAVQRLLAVQRQAGAGLEDRTVHAAAAAGVRTTAVPLPHLARIQASFGPHPLGNIKAHLGAEATASAHAMDATAFATGEHVVFAGHPDLRTAAHEAAHVIQQRAGVQLAGGVGRAGDAYERKADAVADAVVRGESVVEVLPVATGREGAVSPHVQRQPKPEETADCDDPLIKDGVRRANKVKCSEDSVEMREAIIEQSTKYTPAPIVVKQSLGGSPDFHSGGLFSSKYDANKSDEKSGPGFLELPSEGPYSVTVEINSMMETEEPITERIETPPDEADKSCSCVTLKNPAGSHEGKMMRQPKATLVPVPGQFYYGAHKSRERRTLNMLEKRPRRDASPERNAGPKRVNVRLAKEKGVINPMKAMIKEVTKQECQGANQGGLYVNKGTLDGYADYSLRRGEQILSQLSEIMSILVVDAVEIQFGYAMNNSSLDGLSLYASANRQQEQESLLKILNEHDFEGILKLARTKLNSNEKKRDAGYIEHMNGVLDKIGNFDKLEEFRRALIAPDANMGKRMKQLELARAIFDKFMTRSITVVFGKGERHAEQNISAEMNKNKFNIGEISGTKIRCEGCSASLGAPLSVNVDGNTIQVVGRMYAAQAPLKDHEIIAKGIAAGTHKIFDVVLNGVPTSARPRSSSRLRTTEEP